MNKHELVRVLESTDFPKDSCSIDEVSDESLCLIHEGKTWRIFYSERGQRTEERSYPDEAEACSEFFERLKHMLGR